MLSWKKKWAILMGGLAVSSAVLLAQEPRDPGRRGGIPWDTPRVKEQLSLTDEQVAKLKAQSFEAAKERVKVGSQVRIAEIELRQLMDAASPDDKAVAAKAKEIGDLRARIYQARVAGRLAVKKILTAEQQQKLRELGPPRGPRGPREGRPGRPPGPPPRRPGEPGEPADWDDPIGVEDDFDRGETGVEIPERN